MYREVQLLILYDTRENRYTINRQLYDMEQFTTFFTNLQQVKAWFGGVQLDQVERSVNNCPSFVNLTPPPPLTSLPPLYLVHIYLMKRGDILDVWICL